MANTPLSPVTELPIDAGVAPQQGIAICLSGGGYRAMLFHLGSLWRMAELGLFSSTPRTVRRPDGTTLSLGRLERVSSVSGGSIVAGQLGLKWTALQADQPGVVDRYVEHVVKPIRALAGETLAGRNAQGIWSVLEKIVLPGSVNGRVAKDYAKHLYGDATLQDLPDDVRFVINASNLQSGALWRFSKPYMWDWRVGKIERPTVSIARAVAASSAFPPILAPARFSFKDSDFVPNTGGQGDDNLQKPPYTTQPALADGGVYDNLGLETAYKRYRTLLVSNAGSPFAFAETVHTDWVQLGERCIDLMDNQVLSLRKRLLLQALDTGERTGAFWDIDQDIAVHKCATALTCAPRKTAALARTETDLASKSDESQECLINWGYAVADAAIRGWLDPGAQPAPNFPYPRGVG